MGSHHHRTVSRRAFTLGAVGVLAACSSTDDGSSAGTSTDGVSLGPPPEFTGDLAPLVEGVTVPPDLPAMSPTIFRGVRLFDGENVTAATDVVISDGVVATVGEELDEPDGAEVVEGAGRTLLPGMIDSHVHTWPEAQLQAAQFGVLTELDLFVVDDLAAQLEEQQGTGATERPDVFCATSMATAPEGHGTQYGLREMELVTDPTEAAGWVEDRVSEGAAYIKIVIESGFGPTLDQATVAALVDAAHEHSLRALIHTQSLEDTLVALSVPLDGLAHTPWEELPPDVVTRIAEMGIFVVTTAGIATPSKFKPVVQDDQVMDRVSAQQRGYFRRAPYASDGTGAAMLTNLTALHAADVPLLAGTDSGNPGTASGAGMLAETELLVQAGHTPVDALAAATSLPANTFGLTDRGRIAEGLRGDVVLVEGDPTSKITDLHRIAGVWKWGVPVEMPAA